MGHLALVALTRLSSRREALVRAEASHSLLRPHPEAIFRAQAPQDPIRINYLQGLRRQL